MAPKLPRQRIFGYIWLQNPCKYHTAKFKPLNPLDGWLVLRVVLLQFAIIQKLSDLKT